MAELELCISLSLSLSLSLTYKSRSEKRFMDILTRNRKPGFSLPTYCTCGAHTISLIHCRLQLPRRRQNPKPRGRGIAEPTRMGGEPLLRGREDAIGSVCRGQIQP